MGYREEEIIGRDWFDNFIPAGCREKTRAVFEQLMAGETEPAEYFENPVLTRSGEERTVAWHNTVLRDEEGQTIASLSSGEDITERKRAEEALRESEKRLRTVLDAVQTGIVLIDAETHAIAHANRVAIEMIGASKEQIIGSLCHAYICPSQEGRCPITDLGQTADSSDCILLKADGEIVPILKTVTSITLDGRQQLLESFVDITERVQAEEALAKQHNLLRTLIDNLPDYVFTKDTESRFIITNAAHLRVLGAKTLEEVVGKTDFDFFSRELAEQYYAAEQEVFRLNQTLTDLEEFTIGPDMRGQWLLTTKVPLRDSDGSPVGLVGISRDITKMKLAEEALQESEQLLRSVIDTSPNCIFVKDRGARYTLVNRAIAELYGTTPEDMLGKTDQELAELLHLEVEEAAKFSADDREVIESQREKHITVEPFTRADGTTRWFQTTKTPLTLQGEPGCALGVAMDISERVQAEKRLQQYANELEQRNEEVKQFAYIVSHDLRAPLVNLKGFSAELRSALEVVDSAMGAALPHVEEAQREALSFALKEDVPEALEFIESSVTRMDKFIGAVLQLSRLGYRELALEPLDVQDIVDDVLASLAHQIGEQGIGVTIGPLPEVVADLTSIEQIMDNLLSNAIKYLDPERPGKIEIGGERRDGETVFHVRDNGRGIVEEDMDKVFAIFRRAGKADVTGEGVGLLYVQKLVRRHGGRIWCESEPAVGSTFSFAISNHLEEGENDAQ